MKTVINVIRYIVACFFLLGFFTNLSSGIILAITFLLLAISIAPFVYQLMFKNSNLSNGKQITIQIIAPIVVFIIMAAVIGFTK